VFGKAPGLFEAGQITEGLELSSPEGCFEAGEEEPAEQTPQRFDRQKEGRPASDPSLAVWREAAAGNDAMNMRVVGERLAPGMKHGEQAGLGAQTPWIGGERHDGLCRASHQEGIDHGLVLKRDRRRARRQGEDDMEVRHGEKLGLAGGEPVVTRGGLAFGAMPVSTGVVGDAGRAAIAARFDVATERGGPAQFDRAHDAPFDAPEMASMVTAIGVAVTAKDVRQLEGGHGARQSAGRHDL
jgi:hypothetical protein